MTIANMSALAISDSEAMASHEVAVIDVPTLAATDALEIDPVLTDFFWLDLAIRLQEIAKESDPAGILHELDTFFRTNAETVWTCGQVEAAFDSVISALANGNAHFARSKFVRRTWNILFGKQKEERTLEALCQMRFYFHANPNKDDQYTGTNVADINGEITILA